MSASSLQGAPPQIRSAIEQLKAAIRSVDGRAIDEHSTPWREIEKSIIKLLGGAFNIQRADHQAVALGLAGIYAARLISQHQAFWFPNREALEGAAIGFPEALLVVSPFGAVVEALSRGDLSRLDLVAKEIATSLAQVRFSPAAGGSPTRLTAEDYRHIFDPSFVQFVAIDPTKAKGASDAKVGEVIVELRNAVSRAGARIPNEARALIDARIIAALERLDGSKALREQAARGPRVFELVNHLFASVGVSGLAPEEFWEGVVFPLLHIGVPADFPPLEAEDLAAFSRGLDPLLLFADLIPYKTSAPEDGPLGAFAASEISLFDPAVPASTVRLLKLDPRRLQSLLDALDLPALQTAIQRFTNRLEQRAGPPPAGNSRTSALLKPAAELLADLQRLWKTAGAIICLRHLTEAEATLEPSLSELRTTLQGPRIILL